MPGQLKPIPLQVLDCYLRMVVGEPDGLPHWSLSRIRRAAQAGMLDGCVSFLQGHGTVRPETEPGSGISCVYTVTRNTSAVVCYLSTAAPLAALVAYDVKTSGREVWDFDRVITLENADALQLPLAGDVAAAGFRLVSQEELAWQSPYRSVRSFFSYWELLFDDQIDPPWS